MNRKEKFIDGVKGFLGSMAILAVLFLTAAYVGY